MSSLLSCHCRGTYLHNTYTAMVRLIHFFDAAIALQKGHGTPMFGYCNTPRLGRVFKLTMTSTVAFDFIPLDILFLLFEIVYIAAAVY